MSVSITLPTDLEQFVIMQAKQVGVPVETLLVHTIVEKWDVIRRRQNLTTDESKLLQRLQSLFPSEQTTEYRHLCNQSDSGTLSEPDRLRLISLIEQRDHQNAERLKIVGELATIRSMSVREMMTKLSLQPE